MDGTGFRLRFSKLDITLKDMPTLEEIRSNLLSPEEATEFLPYSQTHILDLARKGQLPCIKIGRKVFFKKNELAAILDKGLVTQIPVIPQKETA